MNKLDSQGLEAICIKIVQSLRALKAAKVQTISLDLITNVMVSKLDSINLSEWEKVVNFSTPPTRPGILSFSEKKTRITDSLEKISSDTKTFISRNNFILCNKSKRPGISLNFYQTSEKPKKMLLTKTKRKGINTAYTVNHQIRLY